MNNNLNDYVENTNKFNFECRGTNFNEFQRDLIGFIANYLDIHNKRRFFDINV